jgi:FKBP-type peptidyl-prolyl cis-trans isomerase FklB
MKKVFIGCLGLILMSGIGFAADRAEPKDEMERINYSIGYQIGGDFQRQGWKLDSEMLTQGIRDAVERADPLMPPGEMSRLLVGMKKKLLADEQMMARQSDAVFLGDNAKKEGVVILPSGVQYRVIKEGTGKKPMMEDSVTIRYRVGRVDGKEVVTGSASSEPKTYPLKKALPGLQETLQMMKEGSVWQIVLPPGPALGVRGEAMERAGVFVYELELISVQPGG